MEEHVFCEKFATEEKCKKYIFETKWGEIFKCPYCGEREAWVDGDKFKCKKCMRKTSLKTGTIFEKSHIELTVWFQCLWDAATALKKGKLTTKSFRSRLNNGSKSTPPFVLERISRVIERIHPRNDNRVFGICAVVVRVGRQNKLLIVATEEIGKNIGTVHACLSEKNSPDVFVKFVESNIPSKAKIAYNEFPMTYKILIEKKYTFDYKPSAIAKAKKTAELLKREYIKDMYFRAGTIEKQIGKYCKEKNDKYIYIPPKAILFEELAENAVLINQPSPEIKKRTSE